MLQSTICSARYPWSIPKAASSALEVRYSNGMPAVKLDFNLSDELVAYSTYYFSGTVAVEAKRWMAVVADSSAQSQFSAEVNTFYESGKIRSAEYESETNTMIIGFDEETEIIYKKVAEQNARIAGLFFEEEVDEQFKYLLILPGHEVYYVYAEPFTSRIVSVTTEAGKKVRRKKVLNAAETALTFK